MTSAADTSDVDRLIEEAKQYDFVRFMWSDIHGIQRVMHISNYSLPSKIRHGTGVIVCEYSDYGATGQ